MKFDQPANDSSGRGRFRDERAIKAWNYDNNLDGTDREFGAVTVYMSDDGYYRAGDSYDSAYTRWYRNREKVERAAQAYATKLAGPSGDVDYEDL